MEKLAQSKAVFYVESRERCTRRRLFFGQDLRESRSSCPRNKHSSAQVRQFDYLPSDSLKVGGEVTVLVGISQQGVALPPQQQQAWDGGCSDPSVPCIESFSTQGWAVLNYCCVFMDSGCVCVCSGFSACYLHA